MSNYNDVCVCCGRYVPEGRQVCPICEGDILDNPKSEIQAAFLRARFAIEALCSEIVEILTPIIAEIAAKFAEFWRSLKLFLFGAEKYRKIIHLAKYGKNARTRKKNITRLIRLLERGRYKPG